MACKKYVYIRIYKGYSITEDDDDDDDDDVFCAFITCAKSCLKAQNL